MIVQDAPHAAVARRLAAAFATHPQVTAVALAGSRVDGGDDRSDVDLYVYLTAELPVQARAALIAAAGADHAGRVEVDNRFWETGDEWTDAATGLGVDVMYRDPRWIEGELARVLDRCEAALGYSTCLWHNVLSSAVLFDRAGWLGGLKRAADRPYPEALRQAVVAKNLPVLRQNRSSYLRQMELAVARSDAVSLNHRATALLASCFDILFALNRRPHPGEKRLLEQASQPGLMVPEGFGAKVLALLDALGPSRSGAAIAAAHAVVNGIEELVRCEGPVPPSGAQWAHATR